MDDKNGPTLRFVGVVHSSLKTTQDAPPPGGHGKQEAILEIFPAYCLAMEGVQALEKLLVLYWLHHADREVLRVYPGGDRSKDLIGVFTNRSPLRPNPIALSVVEVLGTGIDTFHVRGLDAIDGTPIIDIKAA